MFDIGFWELALVFGLGLMILGPERLPRVAAQLARWVSKARRTAIHLRRQLERELELDELINPKSRPRPMPPAGPQREADGSFPDEQTIKGQPAEEQSSDEQSVDNTEGVGEASQVSDDNEKSD